MQVVIDGTLKADGTLELYEKPALPPGPVRVTVESASAASPARLGLLDALAQIRAAQAARGYTGRTLEEMAAEEAEQAALEKDYEERWQRLWDAPERKS